jgi:CheY-like chemotaxis protein
MRKQILFVDDDPLFIDLANDVLAVQDIEVVAALDGTVALDLLKNFTPQMIVSDFEMPGMNGVELHSRLQQNEMTRNIRFVFMTGSSDRTFSQYARSHNIRVFSKNNLVSDLVRLSSELE